MLFTTFPSDLEYECDIERCIGCCDLFEDIKIYPEEISRIESLGYSDFYEREGSEYRLKKPCPFLRGKLCKIHLAHGLEAKFASCLKHPFVVTPLANGDILVDIKWSCPQVGYLGGRKLASSYLDELLKHCKFDSKVPIEKVVYLSESEKIRVEWRALERLYGFASEFLSSPGRVYEKIVMLTSFVRYVASNSTKNMKIGDVSRIIREFNFDESIKWEIIGDIPLNPMAFSELVEGVLYNKENIEIAARRLGYDAPTIDPASLVDKEFSSNRRDIFSIYMGQTLRETLARPWDMSSSFFWTLGVMGLVDVLARGYSAGEVGYEDIRKGIAVVDYLNKSFREFREFVYPLYPELGMRYLQFVVSEL